MEALNIALGIIASILSIVATVISFRNKQEVESLRDLYESNRQKAKGDKNTQVIGSGNRVNTHGR